VGCTTAYVAAAQSSFQKSDSPRKLGLPEVPVIVLSHLTPTQRRALMIADNRIAASRWMG
jgi:hypothetical protein